MIDQLVGSILCYGELKWRTSWCSRLVTAAVSFNTVSVLQEQNSQFKNGTGEVELAPLQDRSLLALQGKSMTCHCKVSSLAAVLFYRTQCSSSSVSTTRWCERRPEGDEVHDHATCSDGRVQYHWLCLGCGYTGEDGFEVCVRQAVRRVLKS